MTVSPAELALAWVLARPGVTAAVFGPRTPEHVTSALRAVEMTLDAETTEALDELFPGYQPAPEDYAW
jgi:aryl-alcohol dehydrogenase-like predicted oxidoreductase